MSKHFYIFLCLTICVLPNTDAAQTRLTDHCFYSPLGSIDGYIYYTKDVSGDNFDIWRTSCNGTGETRITNDPEKETLFDIYSNKTKIAYLKESFSCDYINTMDVDGENSMTIYSTENKISAIKVSPDNSVLAFVEHESDGYYGTLYLINLNIKMLSYCKTFTLRDNSCVSKLGIEKA
ncbi:MAG: hypothetical protein A2252_04695 [Elusimicrobia bacterium RIFOXYA2_FULL_39_19]|nr:MAG: hypothetical protein A2252_04695 [Elusimicrobia bacterium RIFOXYA2_FULL_39_19]